MGEQGVGRLPVVGTGEEGMHRVLLQISCTQSAHPLQPRTAAASKAGDSSLEREHIMQLAKEVGSQVRGQTTESGTTPGCGPVNFRLGQLYTDGKQGTREEGG